MTNADKWAKLQTNVFKCVQTLSNNIFVWTNIEQILYCTVSMPGQYIRTTLLSFLPWHLPLYCFLQFSLNTSFQPFFKVDWCCRSSLNSTRTGWKTISSIPFPLIYHNPYLKPWNNEDTAKTVTIFIALRSLKLLKYQSSTVKGARWLQYLKKNDSRILTDNSHLFHNACPDLTINCKTKLKH